MPASFYTGGMGQSRGKPAYVVWIHILVNDTCAPFSFQQSFKLPKFPFFPPLVSVTWNNHIIYLHIELRKQGRRSPNEYPLEIEDSCVFGAFLRWHPLKLTMRCVVLLILLIISYSSTEPDVEGIERINLWFYSVKNFLLFIPVVKNKGWGIF